MHDVHKRRVIAYVVTVSFAALALSASIFLRWGAPNPAQLFYFWVLFAIGDRLSTQARVRGIPRAGLKPRAPEISAGFLVLLAAAFATNPSTALVLGLLSPMVPGTWRGPLRSVFNAAQTGIYCGATASIFAIAHGTSRPGALVLVVGACVASLVGILLNTALVAVVMSLERGRSPVRLLSELAWPTTASIPFAFPAALLVAVLYWQWHALAVSFILGPLFVLRQLRQSQIALEDARERTFRAFIRAVELKDPYTSRHSERVALITVNLHRSLGTSEEALERRYYGALLHDIGKVAVSGRILAKPGRLTPLEYEVVQRHAGSGAFVVGSVSFLADLVPEILHHHERIDGGGYPAGLAGDEIPFNARVLAVADTFEALTSDRPYRRGLSNAKALAEIQRSAGTQLDRSVVDALESLLAEGYEFPLLPRRSAAAGASVDQLQAAEA
jgi:hypothetical protein